MGIASRGVAIIGLIAGLAGAAQPAIARERGSARPNIAAARFGAITSRTPRFGPKLVERGGYIAIKGGQHRGECICHRSTVGSPKGLQLRTCRQLNGC